MNLEEHSKLLSDSYERATARKLIELEAGSDVGKALFDAPFRPVVPWYRRRSRVELRKWRGVKAMGDVVGGFYQHALSLNRRTNGTVAKGEVLEDAKRQGYSDGYYGIRISGSGQRFEIRNVLLWNIIDERGTYRGQAAIFSEWLFL